MGEDQSAIPQEAVYPGLGDRWGQSPDERAGIPIPVEYFDRLAEKIVRGICYIEDGRFIEPPYEVDVFPLHSAGAKPIRDAIERFGKRYAREPGIVVNLAVTPEDGVSGLFEIEFWQQFNSYASVLPKAVEVAQEQ